MTTDRLSPVVLTAPAAAVAVVLVTGWATTQAGAESASPEPAPAPAAKTVDAARQGSPEARVLREAIRSERVEVRHLERALDHARARLAAEQKASTVVVAAAPAAPSTSWSSGSSGGSSGSSGSSGGSSGSSSSSGSGSGGSGGGGSTQPPATDTTTSGS